MIAIFYSFIVIITMCLRLDSSSKCHRLDNDVHVILVDLKSVGARCRRKRYSIDSHVLRLSLHKYQKL